MEKESKIMICSDDGEWGREPTQKLSQRGVRALFLKRDSSLLLSKIREERPQLVIMDFLMPGLDAIGVIHAVAQDANVENPLYIVTSSYTNPMMEREIAAAVAHQMPQLNRLRLILVGELRNVSGNRIIYL